MWLVINNTLGSCSTDCLMCWYLVNHSNDLSHKYKCQVIMRFCLCQYNSLSWCFACCTNKLPWLFSSICWSSGCCRASTGGLSGNTKRRHQFPCWLRLEKEVSVHLQRKGSRTRSSWLKHGSSGNIRLAWRPVCRSWRTTTNSSSPSCAGSGSYCYRSAVHLWGRPGKDMNSSYNGFYLFKNNTCMFLCVLLSLPTRFYRQIL